MSDKLNLIETIAKQDQFSTFTRLMRTSNANDVFNGPGDFTVFAPTNDAFAKIPDATMNGLTSETDQKRLRALLSYHILPGKVMAASLASAPARKAFTGEELMFTDINGIKVNGASVQARNLEATNGVAHALASVLTPTAEPRAAAGTTAPLTTPAAIGSNLAAVPNAPMSATRPTTSTTESSTVLSASPAASVAKTAESKTIL